MAENTYIPCPMCTKNWVDENSELQLCTSCKYEYQLVTDINNLVNSTNAITKFHGNYFKPGHIQVVRNCINKLEGLLNVLERYPKRG